MFHIDPTDPCPVEEQLARTVRSAVGAALLSPGDRMPTVRQLAVELRVNANAVAKAYAVLESEGVLRADPGVGVVVNASAEEVGAAALYDELTALEDSFLRGAAELGFSLDEVIIHLGSRRAPDRDV